MADFEQGLVRRGAFFPVFFQGVEDMGTGVARLRRVERGIFKALVDIN
jgi:hypothetical protein